MRREEAHGFGSAGSGVVHTGGIAT
jgi:hypothetical protein